MAKIANKEQIKWMENITDWAQDNLHLLYGESYRDYNAIHRHHVTGRASKHNKVAIGHWFILPVPIELHDVLSNHALNVTHRKKAFIAKFGMQKDLFLIMFYSMKGQGYKLPNMDILNAIMDTNE